jgi:Tol biopolymer transport system component
MKYSMLDLVWSQIRKLWLLILLVTILSGCSSELKYGNYGRVSMPFSKADPRNDAEQKQTKGLYYGWYLRTVRYSPDGSHLLVNMCRQERRDYCRIARYYPQTNKWESFPFEQNKTYIAPDYSPDGKVIALSHYACEPDENKPACDFRKERLYFMNPDGSHLRRIGTERIRSNPSFSSDGSKLLCWGLGEGFRGATSGRYYTVYSVWELNLKTGEEEKRKAVFGIHGTPRYLPDNYRIFYMHAPQVRLDDRTDKVTTDELISFKKTSYGGIQSHCMSPDGEWLLYSKYDDLFRVRLSELEQRKLIVKSPSDNQSIQDAAFSPDGKQAAYFTIYGPLSLINVDGTGLVEIDHIGGAMEMWKDMGENPSGRPPIVRPADSDAVVNKWFPHSIRFSRDGGHLLVNMCRKDNGFNWHITDKCRIARYYIDSNKWESLPHDKDKSYIDPDYSPDGKTIAFFGEDLSLRFHRLGVKGAGYIYLMDADGKNLRPLGNKRSFDFLRYPRFSPDGRRILYWASFLDGHDNIWEMDIQTGKKRQITKNRESETDSRTGQPKGVTDDYEYYNRGRPRYLPDGQHFLFSMEAVRIAISGDDSLDAYERKYGENRVFILDLHNPRLKPLWRDRQPSRGEDISSDGKWLLYSNLKSELHIVGMDDPRPEKARMLWHGQDKNALNVYESLKEAVFSPDGGRVAFILKTRPIYLMNTDGSGLREIDYSAAAQKMWGK